MIMTSRSSQIARCEGINLSKRGCGNGAQQAAGSDPEHGIAGRARDRNAMKDRNQDISGALGRCLTGDDLYRYIACPPGQRSTPAVESHLAKCPDCAEELAQLLKMLHPESDDPPAAVLPPTDNRDRTDVSIDSGSGAQGSAADHTQAMDAVGGGSGCGHRAPWRRRRRLLVLQI